MAQTIRETAQRVEQQQCRYAPCKPAQVTVGNAGSSRVGVQQGEQGLDMKQQSNHHQCCRPCDINALPSQGHNFHFSSSTAQPRDGRLEGAQSADEKQQQRNPNAGTDSYTCQI